MQLQGKFQLIHEMRSYVRAFETKLRLWEIQLGNANYAHFATLQENKPMSTTLFVSTIRHLKTEFSSRLSDICSRENDIKLFSTLFDIQVDVVPERYQMKLIELQCSNEIKSEFSVSMYHCLTFIRNILNPNVIPTWLNIPQKCHPSLAALMLVNNYF